MRVALSAMPRPAASPCPNDPVATSTNGRRGVGCPSRSLPSSRSFSSSAGGTRPDRRPGGVENRRGVALRQHEPVVVRVARVPRVESHLREEQRRDQVGRRRARRRVSAAGRRRRANRVDAQLSGDVVKNGNQLCTVLRHGSLRKARAYQFSMTDVNHRDTETQRTHGVLLGNAMYVASAPKRTLCVLRVFVSLWLTVVIPKHLQHGQHVRGAEEPCSR